MKTAYVIQTSMGQIRLFASQAAAEKWEARQPADCGIVSGAEVSKEAHYRGRIPSCGVRFTKEDMSIGQLIAAMYAAAGY